jgi:hypothetical protein
MPKYMHSHIHFYTKACFLIFATKAVCMWLLIGHVPSYKLISSLPWHTDQYLRMYLLTN